MNQLALDLRNLPNDPRSLAVRYARGLGGQLAAQHRLYLLYKEPYQLDLVPNLNGKAEPLKAAPGFARGTNRMLDQLGVELVYSPTSKFKRSGGGFKVIATDLTIGSQLSRASRSRKSGVDYLVVPFVYRSQLLTSSSSSPTQPICIYPSTDIDAESPNRAESGSRQLLYSGEWLLDERVERLAEAMSVLADFELVIGPALGEHRTRVLEDLFRRVNARVTFANLTSNNRLRSLITDSFAVISTELSDQLGVIPADAMAIGVPTLLSNQTMMQELAGPSGIYFDDVDPLSLALRVRELQRAGAWARASEAALRRSSQLKWASSYGKLDRLIRQLLG